MNTQIHNLQTHTNTPHIFKHINTYTESHTHTQAPLTHQLSLWRQSKAENNPGPGFGTKNNENVGGLIGSKATVWSLPVCQEPEYSPPHGKESPTDEPLGL